MAIRLWCDKFSTKSIRILIRGDNIGSLTLTLELRPKTDMLAIIAREIALCTAVLSFPFDVSHTPGIAHVVVDMLSRLAQPGCEDEPLHPALHQSEKLGAPARDDSYYKCIKSYNKKRLSHVKKWGRMGSSLCPNLWPIGNPNIFIFQIFVFQTSFGTKAFGQ